MDAGTLSRVEESDVLWRVNYDEFIRRFRHQACVKLIKERIDATASLVFETMLKETRAQEGPVKQKFSASMSLEAITSAIRSTSEGRLMTMDRVRSALQQMITDTSQIIQKMGEGLGGAHYVINLQSIVRLMTMQELEGIIANRFGLSGCRVFRLLLMKKQLEQKQIAEMAMIPIKDTREVLYTLLKEEFVQLQVLLLQPLAPFCLAYMSSVENVVRWIEEEHRAVCPDDDSAAPGVNRSPGYGIYG
ncbi:hypothetical protein CBR_g5701 [Chara braunii]|uniref:DNA-directed RNA polymerase III subunit RPC3 n=1 Tax=Chara braunii TaxID=69332 RepID=A0A388JRU9_CHABU|nr:hypothetical protein CBR_g5701 [Chara braunii]|eukprot:GBG60526.1 hypothetical protein CBR_g5701 [Chara braunii]